MGRFECDREEDVPLSDRMQLEFEGSLSLS